MQIQASNWQKVELSYVTQDRQEGGGGGGGVGGVRSGAYKRPAKVLLNEKN